MSKCHRLSESQFKHVMEDPTGIPGFDSCRSIRLSLNFRALLLTGNKRCSLSVYFFIFMLQIEGFLKTVSEGDIRMVWSLSDNESFKPWATFTPAVTVNGGFVVFLFCLNFRCFTSLVWKMSGKSLMMSVVVLHPRNLFLIFAIHFVNVINVESISRYS